MNAEKNFLTMEEIDKLFHWIYDSKPHPTGKEINTIYAKWVYIKLERGDKEQ